MIHSPVHLSKQDPQRRTLGHSFGKTPLACAELGMGAAKSSPHLSVLLPSPTRVQHTESSVMEPRQLDRVEQRFGHRYWAEGSLRCHGCNSPKWGSTGGVGKRSRQEDFWMQGCSGYPRGEQGYDAEATRHRAGAHDGKMRKPSHAETGFDMWGMTAGPSHRCKVASCKQTVG